MRKGKKDRPCPKCKERMAVYYSSYCKPCASKYQSAQIKKNGYKWSYKRREEIKNLIQSAKNKPCADCKKTFPPYVMDFDHIRGKKKMAVSLFVRTSFSLDIVQAEIDKCEVVCSNCHRERTAKRSRILG